MKLKKDIKLSMVTAMCMLALAFISRNYLNVQLDIISQYGPVWMFLAYVITKGEQSKTKAGRSAAFWALAIIITTMIILFAYVL